MSLRWRIDGRLLCGAKCNAETGDVYFDDGQQYEMSSRGVIHPDTTEATTGLWHWGSEPTPPDWALKHQILNLQSALAHATGTISGMSIAVGWLKEELKRPAPSP